MIRQEASGHKGQVAQYFRTWEAWLTFANVKIRGAVSDKAEFGWQVATREAFRAGVVELLDGSRASFVRDSAERSVAAFALSVPIMGMRTVLLRRAEPTAASPNGLTHVGFVVDNEAELGKVHRALTQRRVGYDLMQQGGYEWTRLRFEIEGNTGEARFATATIADACRQGLLEVDEEAEVREPR